MQIFDEQAVPTLWVLLQPHKNKNGGKNSKKKKLDSTKLGKIEI